MTTGVIKTELLGVADAVAREKNIDREDVIMAMEQAIQKACRARYGMDRDIRVNIDRKTGAITTKAYVEVVEVVENEGSQISLEEALKINPALVLGEFIITDLPPIDFGRVAAQIAKQVIFQKVRDAERHQIYNEYHGRVREIINGSVKRVEFNNVIVDLGRAEAFLSRDKLIPRETFHPGDRIRAYIEDVRDEPRGFQIFLSRTHPAFLAQLFAQEVPEIYDGQITIKAVARDPGSRAKMAVLGKERSMDPVGACVGMRGSRVQAVVNELKGEKVDIIPWSDNPAVFVVNALIPAEVSKVVLDEDTGRVEVIVPDEQLSLAIGRRGQNVRLASELTGFGLDIISETQESERRTKDLKERSQLFVQALDVDEVIAHLLVSEGFSNVDELLLVPFEELTTIEGFEEELAQEIQRRARQFLDEQARLKQEKLKSLVIEEALRSLEGMTADLLLKLHERGITTLDDFADLAGDELLEIDNTFNLDDANNLIMKARAHWFN
jgi:N utilization substance protein A